MKVTSYKLQVTNCKFYILRIVYFISCFLFFPDHAVANPLDLAKPPSSSPQPQVPTQQKLKIGCILPLSGEGAAIGQRVLEGIQLAFNSFNITEISMKGDLPALQLVIKDSGGEVNAVNLLESLAKEEDVVAIIGPIFSKTVIASAKVADKYKLPIFSPTASSKNISGISPYIFRNSLTNQIQGKAIAYYSVNHLNLRKFAVLYQRDQYGIELKTAFEDEIKSFGGEIIFSEPFDPDQNDFEPQIAAIGGIKDSDLRKLTDAGKPLNDSIRGKPKPELKYEAIFIPGTADRAGLILPELVYYNISDIPILGGNGLNSLDLIRIGGKYAEGVIFADGFFPSSENLIVKEFVERYRMFYNKEPDIHNANSYDAARILLEIIKNGAKNREDVKNGLLNLKEFNGVSGITTVQSSGDSEKTLYFLTVKHGKIVEMK
ncbi:MAG: ABC transporter substrate-binding protein [Nitrospinae bacterium]|nr:ABC transporter substrate-binding protein [Nitrospinota bacterium]